MIIDTIYIARHGFRLNWITTNWTSATGLPRDPPLAAYGETQSSELAQFFLSLPPEQRPSVILSSPYYRCLQTAVPTVEALKIPLYVEHGLSEWYSPVKPGTGLHPRPASAQALREYFPQIDTSWSSRYYPTRKGETVEDHHVRCGATLKLIITALERLFPDKERGSVLLVGHAASVIALTRELTGDRDLPLKVGCATVTELRKKQDTSEVLGTWEAVKLADATHLTRGAEREWGFDYIVIDEHGQVIEDNGVPGTENEADDPVGPQEPMTGNISRM